MAATRFNGNKQYLVETPVEIGKRGKPLKTKEIGYTRTSNVAKLLEDNNSLTNHQVRVTMLGLAKNPDHIRAVNEYAIDVAANRASLDALAAQCYGEADGWAGADHGTALHDLLEQIETGKMAPEDILLEGMRADVLAYRAHMEAEGLYVLPDWCEHMIVHDDVKVAGTFDCLVGHRKSTYGWPEEVIRLADYKTTKPGSIEYAFAAYCIQLAIYRHGTPYRQHPTFGGERKDWPEHLDPSKAMLIHVPAGHATCDLYEMDLDAGWEAAQHALYAREWRKRSDQAVLWHADPSAHMINLLDESVEIAIASRAVTPVQHPLIEAAMVEHPSSRPHLTLVQELADPTPGPIVSAWAAEEAAKILAAVPGAPVGLTITQEVARQAEERREVVSVDPAVPLHVELAAEPFSTLPEEAAAAVSAARERKAGVADLFASVVAAQASPAVSPALPAVQPQAHLAPQSAGPTKGLRQGLFDSIPAQPEAPEFPPATVAAPEPPAAPPAAPTPTSAPPAAAARLDLLEAVHATFPGTVEELPPDYVPARLRQVMTDYGLKTPEEARPFLGGERSAIRTRMQVIQAHGGLDRAASLWPRRPDGTMIPGLGTDHQHTWLELERLAEVCWAVEQEMGLPFPEEPMRPEVLLPTPAPAAPAVPIETLYAAEEKPSPETLTMIAETWATLPPGVQSRLEKRAADAVAIGRSLNSRFAARNAAIVSMLIVVSMEHDDDVINAALIYWNESERRVRAASSPTEILCALTKEDTAELLALLDSVGTPNGPIVEFDADGKPYLSPF